MGDESDEELWRSVTRDVKALPREVRLSEKQKPENVKTPIVSKSLPRENAKKALASVPVPRGEGLDRATAEKLRKGQIPIEARLDLHGLTQAQALPALQNFIQSAQSSGKRCVLVITGKGPGQDGQRDPLCSGQGVLKRMVPEWLEDAALKPLVLKIAAAKPRDGGDGALYVLLRRKR